MARESGWKIINPILTAHHPSHLRKDKIRRDAGPARMINKAKVLNSTAGRGIRKSVKVAAHRRLTVFRSLTSRQVESYDDTPERPVSQDDTTASPTTAAAQSRPPVMRQMLRDGQLPAPSLIRSHLDRGFGNRCLRLRGGVLTRMPPVASGRSEKVVPWRRFTRTGCWSRLKPACAKQEKPDILCASVDAKITTPKAKPGDVPAPVPDLQRYFSAYPR